MRIKDFEKYKNYVANSDLANIFEVNVDKNNYALYNLNDSLVLASDQIPDSMFKTYTPRGEETPLIIAYNLYNDVRLYWIILKLNNISDSFHKFTSNDTVKYLDYSTVNMMIRSM